jgi:phenylalanyl-tRNA synthetase alpha chain
MGEMKNVPNEKKKEFGQILNEFKQFTEAKYEELKQSTVNGQQSTASNIDLLFLVIQLQLAQGIRSV